MKKKYELENKGAGWKLKCPKCGEIYIWFDLHMKICTEYDNQLDDDPWRLNTTNYPRRLYNRARSIVGTLDGDYLGDAEYVKFLANTVGSLEANLDKTVGTTQYTATFGFPRIIHNSDAVHGTAQKEQIIKQAIDWRALGGRLGTDSELNAMTWV